MESVFEAFISNPALYSAGHLVGETLHFPTNTEEVQSLLKRIGVDGVRCQEYFIISFDSDILGLYDYLGEYENIDELNHLSHLLKELSPSERETLEAVMDSGQHCGSVQDLINLTQNLDCYDFHPGVDNEEMLGRLYVENMESLEVPDNIKPYFDFEAYGRDISINENGHFAPGGYVTKVSDDFREVYHGPQDIPAGHRVFAYPQLSIREQMAAYEALAASTEKAVERFHTLSEELRQTEAELEKTFGLMAATVDYAKTRPVFDGYKAARYSKKYLSEHEAELAAYRAARVTMNELLDGAKLPKMADMKKSRQELAGKKKALYAEYRKAQADMRQAVAVKANIDHLLGVTDGRENKAQER